MLKKIIIIAALILPISVVAQDIKFGHINKQALISSMPEAAKAQKELQTLLEQKQTEGDKMQKEFQVAVDAFNAEADKLDPNVRQTRQEGLQLKQERLRTFAQDAEKELTQKQQELMLPIENKINAAMQQVGREQGLMFIFDDEQPLYISPQSIDVLPMVQKIVNASATPATRK